MRIGIIIYNCYGTSHSGKCFRAAANREWAFSDYKNTDIEIAAFTTCGGCPGCNIEYAPEEMKKNGVTHVHLATGFISGYPPYPYMQHFKEFITEKYGLKVIYGPPIPQKYLSTHMKLNSWNNKFFIEATESLLTIEPIRLNYD